MKIIFYPLIILILSGPLDFGYHPCKLVYKNGLSFEAYVKIPDMLDDYVRYKGHLNNPMRELPSGEFTELVFDKDGGKLTYQQILTYKNYGNKKANENDSWLQVIKTGYLSLYYGYESSMNGPSYKLWYFKKADDSIAYFITMKYSGGIGITIGTGDNFKKNASTYLADYKELSEKILNSEYKFDDIESVVDEYNRWYDAK